MPEEEADRVPVCNGNKPDRKNRFPTLIQPERAHGRYRDILLLEPIKNLEKMVQYITGLPFSLACLLWSILLSVSFYFIAKSFNLTPIVTFIYSVINDVFSKSHYESAFILFYYCLICPVVYLYLKSRVLPEPSPEDERQDESAIIEQSNQRWMQAMRIPSS